jgi:hypothetical protein
MTQSLTEVAASLRAAADTVARVRTGFARAPLGPDVFGAHATGRLGTVGAQLSQVFQSALDDRVAEATDMIDRLNEAAYAIGVSAQRYADVEHSTHQGWGEGSR